MHDARTLVTRMYFDLFHLDAKTVFQHGDLDEIYMGQPKGYEVHGKMYLL
mgnify:CR=1 FL=1